MLQAKHFTTAAALCSASLLVGTAAIADDALEAYRLPDQPAPTVAIERPRGADNATMTNEVAQSEPLECPPGQFPSAFADVYPFHWAYQALNNLASPSMACFDLPEELR